MKAFNIITALVLAVVALCAAAAVAVADPAGLLDGHTITLAIEWFEGFTLHSDSGAAAFAVTGVVAGLKKKRATKIDEARAILDKAEEEERDLTEEEETRWDGLVKEAEQLGTQIERQERQAELDGSLEKRTPVRTVEGEEPEGEPTKPGVKVGEDRKREAQMAHDTLRMLHGLTTRNQDLVRDAQRSLAQAGWYGDEVQQRAAGDYYSTLVDADGAILLPTVVADGIERIGNIYGFARQHCATFNHVVGTLKVPAATGTLSASAVAEGGEISSSMRAFTAVSLNPKKWAIIVPWTYEANLEAGPKILEDAQFAIGLGFARAEDAAVFNGDGSSTYNSIDGILSANRTGVAEYVLGSGDESFDDLDATDIFLMRRKLPAAVRNMGMYAFHPDMEPHLRTLKDGDGRFLYAFNSDTGVATLGGRPVGYTEVLPDIAADSDDTTFGVFGAFGMFKLALGEGMTSENLSEGTIKDADSGASINLATQDLRALKVRSFFDGDTNFEEAFVKITTAAGGGG